MKNGWYMIILESQIKAYPYNYPVAEEHEEVEVLSKVTCLEKLVKKLYAKNQYQCTLCDPTPCFRTYQIVSSSKVEKGAIYKLYKT